MRISLFFLKSALATAPSRGSHRVFFSAALHVSRLFFCPFVAYPGLLVCICSPSNTRAILEHHWEYHTAHSQHWGSLSALCPRQPVFTPLFWLAPCLSRLCSSSGHDLGQAASSSGPLHSHLWRGGCWPGWSPRPPRVKGCLSPAPSAGFLRALVSSL